MGMREKQRKGRDIDRYIGLQEMVTLDWDTSWLSPIKIICSFFNHVPLRKIFK